MEIEYYIFIFEIISIIICTKNWIINKIDIIIKQENICCIIINISIKNIYSHKINIFSKFS